MARVTVEDCLEHLVDQFALVHLATQRYRQLHRGATPLVASRNKHIVQALREIAAEKVRFREPVRETLLKTKVSQLSQRMQRYSEAAALNQANLDDSTPLI